jgi:lysophospholipase L1-like esterase
MVALYERPASFAAARPGPQTRDLIIARSLRRGFFTACLVIGLGLLALPLIYAKAVVFSPLWIYGLLIAAGSLAGIFADRVGREAVALILGYALFADLSLAAGSAVLKQARVGTDLVPNMASSVFARRGFTFHPLLQLAPNPGYSSNGFEHTPKATRAVADAPRMSRAPVDVALIGGSSTYDIDLQQGQTWPDLLQQRLPDYRFWNMGVPSYTTVGHIVQTAWYLPEINAKCAVYYIGWNDVRNTHLPDLDPAYADYHLLDLANHGFDISDRGVTAAMRLATLLVRKVGPYPSAPHHFSHVSPFDGADPDIERIYRRNIETLIGINRQRGVKVAFIGQLLNNRLLDGQAPGQRAFGAPGVEDRNIPAAMKRLNSVLAETARTAGVPYLVPSQDWLASQDYTDFGHFTASGAEKFSDSVAGFINSSCAAGVIP